jgi:prepilin-type N-terminal cleavage/methylation domain-containing protein
VKSTISQRGYTLIEIMVVTTALGLFVALGANLVISLQNFYLKASAHGELQRDARTSMDLIFQKLKQAQSSTVVIDTPPGQGHYSRISFKTVKNVPMQFYQNGNQLIMTTGNSHSIVCSNLFYLAFSLQSSYNPNLVDVTLTMSKRVQLGRNDILLMEFQPIQIMN